MFSARPTPTAVHATMDRVTEELCFLCGPCLDVTRKTISEESSVEFSQSEK
jgi:hypothetical protein